MRTYKKPAQTTDLRTNGRVILAEGEVTGHHHAVVDAAADIQDPVDVNIPAAEFFEEPDGRRVLLVTRPCLLTHQEHAPIALDPAKPAQWRQGDVYGLPIGAGAWEIRRQREFSPEAIRQVAD